jgi:hypothetical protein
VNIIDLEKLKITDVIITDVEFVEETQKMEVKFESVFGSGQMDLMPIEDDEDSCTAEIMLFSQIKSTNKEYEDAAFFKLNELLMQALDILMTDVVEEEVEEVK